MAAGGCVCAPPATDWTPASVSLLNRFDFRSTRLKPDTQGRQQLWLLIHHRICCCATRQNPSAKIIEIVAGNDGSGLSHADDCVRYFSALCQAIATVTRSGVLFAALAGAVYRYQLRQTGSPFPRPVRPIPTRKSRLTRTSDLWLAGHHCWIISFSPMINVLLAKKSISPPSSRSAAKVGGNLRRHFNRRESEERQPGR